MFSYLLPTADELLIQGCQIDPSKNREILEIYNKNI